MKLEIGNIKEILIDSIAKKCGLVKYMKTLNFDNIDVSKDKDYKSNFTSYYAVRRDEAWLEKFYTFLEANKDNKYITIEDITGYLSSIPHKTKNGLKATVEISFASKMLATINPDYAIWDSEVCKYWGVKIPNNLNHDEKVKLCIKEYKRLNLLMHDFVATERGKLCIKEFDNMFPKYKNISSIKKIDFYLWTMDK